MSLISKTGIVNGQTIQAEHVTRIIDALNESGSSAVIATGSFTGSFAGDGSQLTGLSVATSSYALNSNLLDGYDSSYFATTGSNTFNGTQIINGDVTITGTASIAVLHVTYESASVIYSSGSNQLGDATSDIQTLIGTVIVSGSLNVTGSANLPNITGSLLGTSSFAVSASVAQNAISASYAPNSDTASFASTASFITSSNVYGPYGANSIASASYAISASYVIGGINPFPYTGSAEITGSLGVTGSVNVTRLGIGAIGSTSIPLDVRAQGALITDVAFRVRNSGNTDNIISIAGDGTTIVNGSVSAPAFTGSLFGTASWANNSITASYSNVSVSSSFATTASYALTALSASYAPGITTIAQTDVIYVDSVNGADNSDTNRGNIEKPYATVEYVLANTNNSGSVTGDTTNGSATITNVSDTTDIKVGQYITGTNIPYNSSVISKTSNTIVLSQTATGTGSTITLTWWTPKTIKINGNIVATSNWFKAGFWFDCGDSNITWGNFALFNKVAATLIPEYISGGNWYGNNGSSQFMVSNYVSSAHDIFIDINQYLSIGTSTQISLYNAASFRNLIINCKNFDARFGSIASIQGTYANWSGYKYGLLGGIIAGCTTLIVNDTIETPASVNALSGTNAYGIYNGNVRGSVNLGYYYDAMFNSSVIGTTFTARCDSLTVNGNIRVSTATVGNRGNSVFSGEAYGSFTCAGNSEFSALIGNFIASSGTHILTLNAGYYGGVGSITTSGTAILHLNGQSYTTAPYGMIDINLGSGSTIYNYARLKFRFVTNCAGTFINYGYIALNYNNSSVPLTGTFENRGDFELVRGGHGESATYTPSFVVSTGTLILNGGRFFCNLADSKSGLIRKTASGGKLILQGQPYLKVANGLAPLQILSNTGTAQDILDFSMVGNGAVGFRLSDTFSDTTYGTAYAPNLLVGGTAYEDTTYSF